MEIFQRPTQRTEITLSLKIMKHPLPYSQLQVSVPPTACSAHVSAPTVQHLRPHLSVPFPVSQFSTPAFPCFWAGFPSPSQHSGGREGAWGPGCGFVGSSAGRAPRVKSRDLTSSLRLPERVALPCCLRRQLPAPPQRVPAPWPRRDRRPGGLRGSRDGGRRASRWEAMASQAPHTSAGDWEVPGLLSPSRSLLSARGPGRGTGRSV